MNPTDNESTEVGVDDQDELKHNDSDSPGIAAKKARLRAAMNKTGALKKPFKTSPVKSLAGDAVQNGTNSDATIVPPAAAAPDMTRVMPNGQTGGSIGTNVKGTVDILKKFMGLIKPGVAGAEEPNMPEHSAVGASVTLPTTVVNSPNETDFQEQQMRAKMRKADPATLRRFQKKVSTPRGE